MQQCKLRKIKDECPWSSRIRLGHAVTNRHIYMPVAHTHPYVGTGQTDAGDQGYRHRRAD
jgi:hypothetical protein